MELLGSQKFDPRWMDLLRAAVYSRSRKQHQQLEHARESITTTTGGSIINHRRWGSFSGTAAAEAMNGHCNWRKMLRIRIIL
jgi:hypothetical protein